ncbi:thiol:disulfide interchange [Chlorella sorokiniana]|uniref:Thiol:disulfide interchange n=1 Tax=Chlorella sorokiniana TaxID=3076 RepID=A0A2P6TCA5_CHLSO|nr:thiol:disulfide interchange [Chlorella sorokiniana]|eukprot:PRW20258.1 thiol:disulfide interchange [Chlorella sorokiniana]
MATRALALALLATLVATAAAALPNSPFANQGGPPIPGGPTYNLAADGSVASLGYNHPTGYVAVQADPTNRTALFGAYSSWQCVDGKPGYYTALLTQTTSDKEGKEIKKEQLCEFGTINPKNNKYAQSTTECPTATDIEDMFFAPAGAPQKRKVNTVCGTAP